MYSTNKYGLRDTHQISVDIETVEFNTEGERTLRRKKLGTDWPVVYILHSDDTVYVGETCDAAGRLRQHLANKDRGCMEKMEVVFDEEYNKSATLDVEQNLIRLYRADDRFPKMQNMNGGQSSAHEYYSRNLYQAKIPELWAELYRKGLARKKYGDLINSNFYKYSPYTSLNQEQMAAYYAILDDLRESISRKEERNFLINGVAGTGKTILALNLLRTLSDLTKCETNELIIDSDEDIHALDNLIKTVNKKVPGKKLKVAYTVSMAPLRNTLKEVMGKCGLDGVAVLSPEEIAKHPDDRFDVIIVDEAHRIKRRKGLTFYPGFDRPSRDLGMDPDKTSQLDWIIRCSRYRILFYDPEQSIKSSDIEQERFRELLGDCKELHLHTQMRCRGGKAFLDYVEGILHCSNPGKETPGEGFVFRMFRDVQDMVDCIKS